MRPDRFKCNGITGPWQLLSQQHNDAGFYCGYCHTCKQVQEKGRTEVMLEYFVTIEDLLRLFVLIRGVAAHNNMEEGLRKLTIMSLGNGPQNL